MGENLEHRMLLSSSGTLNTKSSQDREDFVFNGGARGQYLFFYSRL